MDRGSSLAVGPAGTRDDIGRAISQEEEKALLEACAACRSRSLYPAVVIALSTCMRYSEIRLLKWCQIDFEARTITVGKSKTAAGTGRVLPLNERALKVLQFWATRFPWRKSEHYMFPAECYGASGDNFTACAYNVDPVKPIGRWKEAWEAARDRAGYILAGVPLPESSSPKRKRAVNSQGEHPAKRQEKPKPIKCRFHDLRHTGCTRMLEAGVPFSVVATVMGWSSATTIRMAKRYGHIGQAAQREAVAFLSGADFGTGRAQNWAQPEERAESGRAN